MSPILSSPATSPGPDTPAPVIVSERSYATRELAEVSEEYFAPPGEPSPACPEDQCLALRDRLRSVLACLRPEVLALPPREYMCGDGGGSVF